MADNGWSWSTCRSYIQWYGIPGAGSYQNTARFGTYWIGGGIYQKFAQVGYECGALKAPVKEYQWLTEFGGVYGMWFEGGAIYFKNGAWQVFFGDLGQTAGRLTEEPEPVIPDDAEVPPDPPVTPTEALPEPIKK